MSRNGRTDSNSNGQKRPPKLRTADCRECLFLNSLEDSGVPASTVTALCDRMWLTRARRGQILYTEGNGATHLYAIRTGRVKLVKIDAQGRTQVTGLLETGDLFGFEALFDRTYTSGAETMEECELCLASADHLHQLITQVPRVATDMARYLHVQLTRTRDRLVAANATGASAKVAAFLLHSAGENGGRWVDNGAIAAGGLTLRELGGLLGLAHETVCRVLAELKSRGLVESLPSGYRIQDVDALREISGL